MVEEQKEEPKKSASDIAFEKLSSVELELGVDLPVEDDGGEVNGHKTLSQKMAEAPNLSDFGIADKRLFPDMGEKMKHLNMLQVSRVFPDTYNPMQSILVKDLLINNEDMSVAEAITYVHTSESIAIDGEGRIDIATIYGGAQENGKLEKEEKKLGMGI